MKPAQIIALLQQGLEHHQAGRLSEAVALYERVRAAAPRNFDAVHLLGTAALQQGRLGAAATALGEARRLDPRSAVCALRLGIALNALGRPAKAEIELRAALTHEPRLPEAWYHLGRVLAQLGRMDEAIGALERAVAEKPDYAEAFDALGTVLFGCRGGAAAEASLRRSIELQPNFARGWCNLGICLVPLGRLGEALACFDRALALDARLHHAHAGRGLALERCYLTAEAVEAYGAALRGEPGNHQAHSARLMAMHYLADVPRESLYREHLLFGQAAGAAAEVARGEDLRLEPERRLRIGFLSPNFRAHAVAHFIEPLLAGLDPAQFEVFLYHDHPVVDAASARFRRDGSHWRHIAGRSDAAVEAAVRGDRIDVLVDLAGHTEINRMALLARRLAPVQATYLGYPDTTGLEAMDYRLVDALSDPPEESLARETLLRFSPTAWCYAPPLEAPAPAGPPSARGQAPVFGCFNNFAKVTDEMLRAWSRLLGLVPGSRLVLKSFGLNEPSLRAGVQRRLSAVGFDLGRVELNGRVREVGEHLAAYAGIDVALDPFPYHGTTTTCEALWMGVPVVTRAGDRHSSRVGVSLLTAVGRTEWIAPDADAYVRIAAGLAADPRRLAQERAGLRAAMRESLLLDHAGQSARFGQALREMWRKRCEAAEPAETCMA
ncbi:MAG TPA: tetratricopeptide repeat protein [Opitutaceae bacterium]|nr:tetratricopeptide repeat protein [Opitutaceae bacterium]